MFDCTPKHTLRMCLPSLYTKEDEYYSEFPYGEEIGNMYPIIERILDYLPYTDLLNILQINNSNWQQVAKSLLRKRCRISWLCITRIKEKITLNVSDNAYFQNVCFMFLIYKTWGLKMTENVCVHNKKDCKEVTLLRYIEDNFCSLNINYCMMNTSELYPVYPGEKINRLLSVLTIPKINNVKIIVSSDYMNTPSSFYLKETERFICLLALKDALFAVQDTFICNELNGYSMNDVVLCGGYTGWATTFETSLYKSNDEHNLLYVGFIEEGHSTCEAYSVVISNDDDFEECVIKFKENIDILANSFLIYIVCEDTVNSFADYQILCKHFSKIPILGWDTIEVCGWNKVKKSKQYNLDVTITSNFETPCHYNATVLTLITWNM